MSGPLNPVSTSPICSGWTKVISNPQLALQSHKAHKTLRINGTKAALKPVPRHHPIAIQNLR